MNRLILLAELDVTIPRVGVVFVGLVETRFPFNTFSGGWFELRLDNGTPGIFLSIVLLIAAPIRKSFL